MSPCGSRAGCTGPAGGEAECGAECGVADGLSEARAVSLSLSAGCSGLPVSLGRFSTGPCGSMWRTVLALQMGFQSFQADVTDFILLFLVQWN